MSAPCIIEKNGRLVHAAFAICMSISILHVPPVFAQTTGSISVTNSVTIREGSSFNSNLRAAHVRFHPGVNGRWTLSASSDNPAVRVCVEQPHSCPSSSFTTVVSATGENNIHLSAARDDDKRENYTATITFTLSGGGYSNEPTATMEVTVTDTTPTSFKLDKTSLSLNEGGQGSFRVHPKFRPDPNMTINLTSSDPSIVIEPTSLVFFRWGADHGNAWNRYKTVTVSASHDDDTNDESVNITLTGGGYDGGGAGIYEGITSTVSVSVTDDDEKEPALVIAPAESLAITEGSSGILSFKIEPPSTKKVMVSMFSPNGDISISPGLLTFEANAAAPQSVTVNVHHDDDDYLDENAIITVRTSGSFTSKIDYPVAITDDDEEVHSVLVIEPSSPLYIPEGENATLSIRISPPAPKNVRVTINKNTFVFRTTIGGFSLFGPGNHTMDFPANSTAAQTMTIATRQDPNRSNENDTLKISTSGGFDSSADYEVFVVDDDWIGSILVSPTDVLEIGEEEYSEFFVSLSTAPNENILITLNHSNRDVYINKRSLTFTPSNFSTRQKVSMYARADDDTTNDTDTIVLSAEGGVNVSPVNKEVLVIDNDAETTAAPYTGEIEISPAGTFEITEGGIFAFSLRLAEQPDEDATIDLSTSNSDLTLSANSVAFTPTSYGQFVGITLSAREDFDAMDETGMIVFRSGSRDITSIDVSIADNDEEGDSNQPPKTHALALPPPESGDAATLRIHCKQDTACSVAFDCSAQATGEAFQGTLPQPIPAWGAVSVSASDIQTHTGGESWSGKGRLGCALRSSENIGSQVWTRSGEGVLVNNSAAIRSVLEGEAHRADIESIPSPDSDDESNIRIRCSSQEADCLETVFVCYTDDGNPYEWSLGTIERLTTRHIQSEALASGIEHRWEGLGLTCEVRSNGSFTAQVLTRTGGGGALVNNSATGGG